MCSIVSVSVGQVYSINRVCVNRELCYVEEHLVNICLVNRPCDLILHLEDPLIENLGNTKTLEVS